MIRTLNARRLEKVLESGRTRPLVIECDEIGLPADIDLEQNDVSSTNRLMVVKAIGLPEVRELNLFCEILGNLLAREVGILTPAPAFINFTDQFVNEANHVLTGYNIKLQPGIGVGCNYLWPLSPVIGTAHLKQEEFEQATMIYAYDLLVQNPDRRQEKPNCALHHGQIIAFDFELCFSFLLPLIGVQPASWEFSKQGINTQHFFKSALRAKAPNWSPFINSLRALHKDRLEVIMGMLPEGWQEWRKAVQKHLHQIINEIDKLELELQRSLL